MNRKELLTELHKQGVKLWLENDQLNIEAPKGVLTPELRNSLANHKLELVQLLLLSDTNATSLPVIEPDPSRRYQPFPLTDIQQAYWVGRSGIFELGNVAINGYIEFEVSNLDLLRLSAAWQKLIDRHDMLRAVVLPTGEQQVLEKVPAYKISVLDLRGLESKELDTQLEAIRQKLSHQVLPSEQWPLFDIRATYLDKQRVRLHINIDLLMMDARSIQILFQEWNKLYQNPELLLPPLELSFRDYVINKRALQDPELVKRSQDYWFNRLDTLPPAPELPLTRVPHELKEYRFKRLRAQLEPNTWQQLKQRSKNAGLTPSGVLLAAFAEVLTVWSLNPQFTINLTVFERLPLHPQVNQIIGDFTNTNLLAVDNSTQNTFTVRALRLQQQLLQDLDHLHISGVQVLRELVRRRKTGLTAVMPIVFTSILGLNSSTQGDLEFNFLGEEVYSISQTPQVWLDHQVTELQGALVFNWDVVEELFPQGLLDDMFGAYCHFLEGLAQSDELWRSSTRELLPPAQLKQLVAVNTTDTPVPKDALLHTLFFEQVPELEKTFVAPRNPIEELLVATWTEVFQFEHIGIHDDFFELGGHSFLALQLISKIHQKLATNIPLSILFQYSTVAELANFLIKNTDAVTPTYLVPIHVEGTQPPLFCIHPAGGQVMVYQHLAVCLGRDQPVYGLQSRALNDSLQEHNSINNMAVEYAKVIRQHQPNFVQIYGMTETGNCAVSLPADAHISTNPNRLKSVGKPLPGVSVTVLNHEGEVLPFGQIGEICIKSPANMIGYWKLPEATANTLVEGWIHCAINRI